MSGNMFWEERRTYPRYSVKDGAYAALSPDSTIMGQIVNIGRGGLCFRYIVHREQAFESVATHIFVGDNGFYLEKMPYKIVEDEQVDNGSSFSSIVMRQRRVQFSNLSSNQLAQLDYFLFNRTTGKV
ncbi:MAG: PilZ domain-containing protein [Desulfobacteraceae bacterium]